MFYIICNINGDTWCFVHDWHIKIKVSTKFDSVHRYKTFSVYYVMKTHSNFNFEIYFFL